MGHSGPLVIRRAGVSGALPASGGGRWRGQHWARQHPADWWAGPPHCHLHALGVLGALLAPDDQSRSQGRRAVVTKSARLKDAGLQEQPTQSLPSFHTGAIGEATMCLPHLVRDGTNPTEWPPPQAALTPRAQPHAQEPTSHYGAAFASDYLANKLIWGPTGSPRPPLPAQTEWP